MPAPLTTRAYTLRLDRISPDDSDWRSPLWTTHLTVNRGVLAWGDFLLTLRGGLPASLAGEHPDRRVLLALSWLSVEAPCTLAPERHIVARGTDESEARRELIAGRFDDILARLEIDDWDAWRGACLPALQAEIRRDAVWVDRSAVFTELGAQCSGLTSEWAAATFFDLIGGASDYFQMPNAESSERPEPKDFAIKAGNWLSTQWGSGAKSDTDSIATALERLTEIPANAVIGKTATQALRALSQTLGVAIEGEPDAEALYKLLKKTIGWIGRPSKGTMALERLRDSESIAPELWSTVCTKLREEITEQRSKSGASVGVPSWMPEFRQLFEQRIGMPFRTSKDHIWEYAVMLDHALRRVSAAHTWIKRAEAARSKFDEAAAKIVGVPAAAVAWLDAYCAERSESSDAIDGYRIRRNALDGWDLVLKRWSRTDCDTAELRARAVGEVQSNLDDNDKWGDARLFEDLAVDEALCVWHGVDGKPNSDVLENYVAARTAEYDRLRFKVPAYRHPDPLRNPVFVDFGNSRWDIEYSALQAAQKRQKLREKLATAKTDKARHKIESELREQPSLCEVSLNLWTRDSVAQSRLRWRGERLRRDLNLDQFESPGPTVTRADRFGRAMAGAPLGPAALAQVFAQKEWNGRLQAPRRQLNELADLVYGKRQPASYDRLADLPEKARRRLDRLGWFLTMSAKLQPAGPWLDFVENGLAGGWEYKQGRSGAYLNHADNKGRPYHARLRLARLPEGLRVIGFDLGHRYAAACAVWQTLATATLKREIAGRAVIRGGRGPRDLYLHTRHTDEQGKSRTTIYRRIGADTLADGTPHPAPWARLDRQFVIKLQGEERRARRPNDVEIKAIEQLGEFLHLDDTGRQRLRSIQHVDELMAEVIGQVRRGLRRHGDCARIAYAFRPGSEPADLLSNLVRWQQLAAAGDAWAAVLWRERVQPIVDQAGGPPPLVVDDENSTPVARRRRFDQYREQLERSGVADALARRNPAELSQLWADRWAQRDREWREYLHWLRRWLLPRGAKAKSDRSIRNVGGLGYDRIVALRGLYQAMKAYRMRPEPDDPRKNVPALGDDSLRDFGARVLLAVERLRTNRVKQLASRIVEAALGVGSENREHWTERKKRPRARIDEPAFAPCHVVIGENLEHYRPEEVRTRRENRRLMDWAARNVRKYIAEGCELNGLHFDEVSARYTSQQDSRTASPGVRCVDVTIADFLENSWWRKQVARSEKKATENKGNARDQYLLALDKRSSAAAGDEIAHAKLMRIPLKSGQLFVSANPISPAGGCLQADLNAAANIGLRALLDPDWEGRWWYIPCDLAGKPLKDKVGGALAIDTSRPLPVTNLAADSSPNKRSSGGKKKSDIINLWRDIATCPLTDGNWQSHSHYWNHVQTRVVEVLRRQAGLDTEPAPCNPQDEHPF